MSKMLRVSWIAAAVIAVTGHGMLAKAQAQQSPPTVPVPRHAVSPTGVQTPSSKGAVRRQISMPEGGMVAQRIRVIPATIITNGGIPFSAQREEGRIGFNITDGKITEEVFRGGTERGTYSYDHNGRFERIQYTDGAIISAAYGDDGELLTLTSSNGRTIGFYYEQARDGSIDVVTPTHNVDKFHTAVALLRLREQPRWWNDPTTYLRAGGGENIESKADGGGKSQPEYPGDPMPDQPKAPGPDGTLIPTVPVSAPRLPDDDPAPFVEPTIRNGTEIIPGAGAGRGRPLPGSGPIPAPPLPPLPAPPLPPGPVGEAAGLIDWVIYKAQIVSCRWDCDSRRADIDAACDEGPTYADRVRCHYKAAQFVPRCKMQCDKGDFTHSTETVTNAYYFPWW